MKGKHIIKRNQQFSIEVSYYDMPGWEEWGHRHVCELAKKALQCSFAVQLSGQENKDWAIVNLGDGYCDVENIFFCPFCGMNLSKINVKDIEYEIIESIDVDLEPFPDLLSRGI